MLNKLTEIFNDEKLVNKIKVRLPYLFQLAELESSRAGKIGMEVGSLLVKHRETRSIEINWKKTRIDFNPYKRWVDYWKED